MSGNTGQQKDLFDELDKLVEQSKNWQCELLFNESLPDSEQSNFVDLATFLGKQEYMFPTHFCGPASESKLIMELRMASIKAGFVLEIRSSKTQSYFDKHPNCRFGKYITLCCQKHRIWEKQKKTKDINKCTTRRATCIEEACPFVCHLRMNKLDNTENPGCWTLSAGKGKIKILAIYQYFLSKLKLLFSIITK